MKKFFSEFKEFISRGSVLDMAVGIIVGQAFTAIVTSLVNDVLMPLVGMLCGGINLSELSVTIGTAKLMYGAFLQAIVNFLIIAFVIFCIVKAINTVHDKAFAKKQEVKEEPKPDPQIVLLTEIRDLLQKEEAAKS